MNCPKCQGDCWDNRQKKAAGTFKPNAPDFSCKNKDGCGWNSGFVKVGAPVAAAPAYQAPANAGPVVAPGGGDALVRLFWDCFDEVLAGLKTRAVSGGFPAEQIASMTATLFIQRAKAQ